MLKKINIIIITILSSITTLSAQITTGSPFSAYGYGIIENAASGTTMGMGGASTGIRFPKEINTVNPAAYSAMPIQTFLFNAGLRTKRVKYTDDFNSAVKYDNAFTGINAAFSINNFLAAGFGAMPYSSVGYKVFLEDELNTSNTSYNTKTNYYGEGGLNKIYFATSAKYKGFALGVNLSYLFGNMKSHTESSLSQSKNASYMLNTNKVNIKTILITYGLQYYYEFAKYNKLTLGITYNHKKTFDSKLQKFSKIVFTSKDNSITDTIQNDTTPNIKSQLPQSLSFGASYHTKHWLYAIDYSTSMWKNIETPAGTSSKLINSYRIAGGVEYTPSPLPENYAQAIKYRLGMYYNKNYFNINNNPVNTYAVTFGIGLPAVKSRTTINLAIEIGNQGSLKENKLKEAFIGLNVSLNMSEIWFIQQKFQ